MGAYINPPNMTKEEWLKENAAPIENPNDFDETQNMLYICLVDNGIAIAHNRKELEVFSNPNDTRPKSYFVALKSELLKVSNLKDYLNER